MDKDKIWYWHDRHLSCQTFDAHVIRKMINIILSYYVFGAPLLLTW